MAVALGTGTPTRSVAPATYAGAPVVSAAWATSGSDLLILLYIAMASATATVTAVSWSLGSGTPVERPWVRAGISADLYQAVWGIPAPVAGSGTYSVTLSENVPYQISGDYFTGAHQIDPIPSADVDIESSVTVPDGGVFTLTPTNVAAADAMAVGYGHRTTGDTTGWSTGTSTYENNTTGVNMLTGYRLGVGSMSANAMSGGTGTHAAAVGVRIAAAAAPPGPVASVGQYVTHLGGRGAGW